MLVPSVKFNINEISVHARSKKELYRMLQFEGDVYLPPLSQAKHNYIAGILSGKKKFVKGSQMKLIYVPHINGLKSKDILKFSQSKVDIKVYLPEFKDKDKLPERTWLCNIVSTLSHADFKKFVSSKINENDAIQIRKRREEIDVIPEISEMFKNSEIITKQSGRFSKLLKSSRKRKWDQIEEDKEEEKLEELSKSNKEKERAINDLQQRLRIFEKKR